MYLSPDALHVLDGMVRAVPQADIYALNDDRGLLSQSLSTQVTSLAGGAVMTSWPIGQSHSKELDRVPGAKLELAANACLLQAQQSHWVYNMGMALGERAWAKIARCAAAFCAHDDYNWDWSLQAVGARCVPGQFTTVVMKGSRLFHTGKW